MKLTQTFLVLIIWIGFVKNATAQCDDIELTILTQTGEWAEEMSWNLYDSNNLIGSFQGMEGSNYTNYSNDFCLEPGCYFIEALDSWGDGWNGGEITLSFENNTSIYSLTGETFIGYEGFEVGQNTGDCEFNIYGCTYFAFKTTTKVIEEVTEEDVNPKKKKKILDNKKEKEKKHNERAKDFYCSKVNDPIKCNV